MTPVNEWANQTTLHPLGLIAVTVLGLAMIVVPRRYAIIPMLIMACFVAPAQRVVIATLDFNLLRLMVLFGCVRVMARGELKGLSFRAVDAVMILWAISGTVAMTLLYVTPAALIQRLGASYDALGMYFLFRCLVRDFKDLEAIATGAAWLSLPVALAFVVERSTGRNVLSIFGGVPAITMIRNGSLRCQGAFSHPIIAGAFWASLLPLMMALGVRSGGKRILAVMSCLMSAIIIVACASSTPVMSAMFAVMAMMAWPLRHHLAYVRWGTAGLMLALQVVMNHPVWHLLTYIDLAGGSTGWYRYKLIDDFVRNVGDWCLVGTKSVAAWREWGNNDTTNMYVLQGTTGGLMTLLLFVVVIVLAFRGLGRSDAFRAPARAQRLMAWAVGSMLFVHCVTFIGTSYFGQIQMLWFLTLAMAVNLSGATERTRRVAVCRRPRTPDRPRNDGRPFQPGGMVTT